MRGLLLFGLLAAAASGGLAHADASRACAPPRGPGDSAVHSDGLHVAGITCGAGRKVALKCSRFSYGRAGACRAIAEWWRCTSTKPHGSTSVERCVAGRKSMRIRWLD
jgi:hypothetical protein